MLFSFIPLLSILVLFDRFPVLVIGLSGFLVVASLFYINRYALRNSQKSITQLRLHKDTASITYKNHTSKSLPISRIGMSGEWILLQLGAREEKIILDRQSVGIRVFSSLARQVKTYQNTTTSERIL